MCKQTESDDITVGRVTKGHMCFLKAALVLFLASRGRTNNTTGDECCYYYSSVIAEPTHCSPLVRVRVCVLGVRGQRLSVLGVRGQGLRVCVIGVRGQRLSVCVLEVRVSGCVCWGSESGCLCRGSEVSASVCVC